MREFDLLLFGASGFTGQFVVEELAVTLFNTNIKWAIAGRNSYSLYQVLIEAGKNTGIDLSKIHIIEANIIDNDSLRRMTKKTKILLNCVGPYILFGEQVIKACLDTYTHILDISAEFKFIKNVYLKYNDLAKSKGIYVINSCGFDSIPTDLGVRLLKNNFNGKLNSVESYLRVDAKSEGFCINYGTWISMLNGFEIFKDIGLNRCKKSTTQHDKKLKLKMYPSLSKYCKGLYVPFPGSDRQIVERTEAYFYENKIEDPVQIETYFTITGILNMIKGSLMGAMLLSLIGINSGRSLLATHPKFFSLGLFRKGGPSRKVIKSGSFINTIVGKGWVNKKADVLDTNNTLVRKTLIVKVKGNDLGYLVTSACLVQAALTLSRELDKIPSGGGVLTPGAAFADTMIYDNLKSRGLTFELIETKDVEIDE